MKRWIFLASLIASSLPTHAAGSEAPVWVAICRGDKEANYRQVEGGQGVFNQSLGDGSYETLPMRQTFLNPGHVICGAAQNAARVAQACADADRQIIFFKIPDPKRPKAPPAEAFFCRAAVKIH